MSRTKGSCTVSLPQASLFVFADGGRMMIVGVVGAGRMGMPIVGHLVRAGHQVLVCERNPKRIGEVESRGGRCVDQETMADTAEVILVCVGYDSEVRELLNGPGGIVDRVRADSIIAVLSTILPKTMQELAELAAPKGVHVVDATVCRGGRAADDGSLLSFVGGDKAIVERLKPVLGAYSSDIVHSGGVGTAQVSKAVNNLILWACLVANHEGMALAHRFQVDTDALRVALMGSSAVNGALGNWGNQSMAWAQDDMAIVAQMAEDCGISLPQSGVVREICRSLKPRRYQIDQYGV